MALYDRPVRLLMREMADAMNLGPGVTFTRNDALEWFRANYPLVKVATVTAHLTRLSTNNRTRLHYSPRDDDVFFQLAPGRYRRFDPNADPAPIREGVTDEENAGEVEEAEVGVAPTDSEFAYEHDLRDYLARNLHLIEPGLRLYEEEGVTGVEFPVGGRFVDILALDSQGQYVVVELKVSRGYDRTVGQLLRYISWIELHHADTGQKVRGVIVAKSVSEDLRLACRRVNGVALYEYELAVALKAVPIGPGATGD